MAGRSLRPNRLPATRALDAASSSGARGRGRQSLLLLLHELLLLLLLLLHELLLHEMLLRELLLLLPLHGLLRARTAAASRQGCSRCCRRSAWLGGDRPAPALQDCWRPDGQAMPALAQQGSDRGGRSDSQHQAEYRRKDPQTQSRLTGVRPSCARDQKELDIGNHNVTRFQPRAEYSSMRTKRTNLQRCVEAPRGFVSRMPGLMVDVWELCLPEGKVA